MKVSIRSRCMEPLIFLFNEARRMRDTAQGQRIRFSKADMNCLVRHAAQNRAKKFHRGEHEVHRVNRPISAPLTQHRMDRH